MRPAGLFPELTRHFFGRFFDKESLSPQGAPEAPFFQTLGLLAPVNAFVALFAIVFHVRGWDLAGMRLLFISFSMSATGVAMVFEWDALFPDRRDYLILTPLPLRVWTLFAAKMTALAVFLGALLAAINFFGVLFWPAIENRANPFAAAGLHLCLTALAGLYTALSIAALQGILASVFRGAAYRRVSVVAQTAVMSALILLLCLAPLMGSSLPELCRTHSPFLRWIPAFWFTGLYEQIRPAVVHVRYAGAGPVLAAAGPIALRATTIAAAAFLLTFLPQYRRHARRVLETAEPNPRGPSLLSRGLARLAAPFLHDPVAYGVFQFTGQTIARSLKHRLFLATYGGFGAALVVISYAGSSSLLRAPFILAFVLVSGLRAAFNFPSDLRANWAFQSNQVAPTDAYTRGARLWVVLCAILPLFVLLGAIEIARAPLPAVAFHFCFGVLTSIALMEALFAGYSKAPFTCSTFPGKVNLVFLVVAYVFGFTRYSSYLAGLESWLSSRHAAAAAFLVTLAIALALIESPRFRALHFTQPPLDFEDNGDPTVRTLGLTGG